APLPIAHHGARSERGGSFPLHRRLADPEDLRAGGLARTAAWRTARESRPRLAMATGWRPTQCCPLLERSPGRPLGRNNPSMVRCARMMRRSRGGVAGQVRGHRRGERSPKLEQRSAVVDLLDDDVTDYTVADWASRNMRIVELLEDLGLYDPEIVPHEAHQS